MTIYLDHNATTPLDERVFEAMRPYMMGRFGNPSSLHHYGREARQGIDQAREQVAALVNAHPSQVIFTSGGTEANNMVFKGLTQGRDAGRIVISSVEHPSILNPAQIVEKQGWQIEKLMVDQSCQINRDQLGQALQNHPEWVSVMMANNEVGVINDIASMAEQSAEEGVLFHTDAVQALGKIDVDFTASGVQLMTLSSHKIYGPKGCGALIVDKRVDLAPILVGGGQEKGRRAGTENVAAIVGFGYAAELAASALQDNRQQLLTLRAHLEQALLTIEGVTIFAHDVERLPNTVMFSVPGVDGETMLMNLDSVGFAVSSGSACESGSMDPSHVLVAMGVREELARGAVRVSLGKDNSIEEINAFIQALRQQIEIFKSMATRLPV